VSICYGGDELSGNGTPDCLLEEEHYPASVVSVCTCSEGGFLGGVSDN
jgi:hypothetical protein